MAESNNIINYHALDPQQSVHSNSASPSDPSALVSHVIPQSHSSLNVPIAHPMGTSRGPPPSYEEANNPNAPPPSYDSLYGRVREVHKSSSGILDFLKKLIFIIAGTLGCTIVIGVTIVIPIAMIVVGAIYFNECPAEENIPMYLVVGGCVAVFKQLLSLRSRVRRSGEEIETENSAEKTLNSLISFFLFCWFLTGCFWVYQIYEPDYYDFTSPMYCNEVPYLFAYWLMNGVFIVLGSLSLCMCCVTVTAMCLRRDER